MLFSYQNNSLININVFAYLASKLFVHRIITHIFICIFSNGIYKNKLKTPQPRSSEYGRLL